MHIVYLHLTIGLLDTIYCSITYPYSQQGSKNKHESVTIHVCQGFQLFGVACPLRQLKKTGYNSIGEDVQKVRARAVGAEHEQMLMRSDGYMTAWMLFLLSGDEEAGSVFVGENAEILHNANWQDVEKNR